MNWFKRLAYRLPASYQRELKRLHFARLIRKGLFKAAETYEQEFRRLDQWVSAGDTVLDVGANVGNYTARLSELVGPTGHVYAFEPMPDTFELLSANMARFPLRNISLFNVAASDGSGLCGMSLPKSDDGLDNPYMAHLADANERAELSAFRLSIDALNIPERVTLVKIDVEGHELAALRGMQALLRRDHPLLIVEGRSAEVEAFLASFGYSFEQAEGSPNRVFRTLPTGNVTRLSPAATQILVAVFCDFCLRIPALESALFW
jgi:FkbM family methyltransferase